MAFVNRNDIPKRAMKVEWQDRRIILYTILIFSLGVNCYGAVIHPLATETSLISRICLSSLETVSVMFGGYILGRVVEKHSSLRGKDAPVSVESTDTLDEKSISYKSD